MSLIDAVKQDSMTVEYYGLQIAAGYHMEPVDWKLFEDALARLNALLKSKPKNLELSR